MSRVRAHVGDSFSPTSTGTRAVTGVGFQPKVVLPFGCRNTSEGAINGAADLMLGGMTGAAQSAIGVGSVGSVTTSATSRRHSGSMAVSHADGNGTLVLEASRSAIGADGFTLNWSTVPASERILNHICLGGPDLEVSLTQHQMNATNAPQSFAHGLTGGAPTGLMVFTSIDNTIPPATSGALLMSLGVFAGSTQIGAILRSSTATPTTLTRRLLATSAVIARFDVAGAINRSMAVSSVDATNVNCTYPVTTGATQDYFFMLAIRGARCQVGTFDCNGSTSPLTISTPGMTPRLFMPIFLPGGVDNVGTVQNGLELTIGASDGTRNRSCGITDQNGVGTTNARRYQNSSAIEERNNAGTSVFVATAAFSGQSVVLTPTVNTSSSFGQGGYLIIGENPNDSTFQIGMPI